ncbi:uncharacterized protein N0V89_006311 [Didymosphaeria variabile]|uniref:E3 ubiquitin-protein ligase CCNB1IP1 n=1 Tax=Didymosphaeria variabile TaxID=1932322 RepID=A0A9W8XN27_9PLEO|nr:uncharacterized protein N0V89_006311 [Didymosphaeria variabile]KAJ4354574.1 hypothetical protein N0V89_006311 [Didymosphaeria variabile]
MLNPAEDYKTSVLSGLSPTIIMECASRGLAFYSYQASQEIIYQEHLAKSLTEKYANLNQAMDKLIHEANAQIKSLQEKLQAMYEEQASLEHNNEELANAFRAKTKAQQQTQKMYQALKAQVMATQVANAAGEEVDHAMHTIRQSDRYVDKLPGTRSGTVNLNQLGTNQQRGGGRLHNRDASGSSGSSGQQRIGSRLQFNPQLQQRMFGGRTNTGQSAPVGTPQVQGHPSRRSQIPVMGGTRQNAFNNVDIGPPYQASPMTRQPLAGNINARNMNFGLSGSTSKRSGMGNIGHPGR